MTGALADDIRCGFTYKDYLSWDADGLGRCELIYGDVFMMASPTRTHQRLLKAVYDQFAAFLKGAPCEVFFAPIDVRLFPEENDGDMVVVIPDMLVVCDPAKIDDRAVKGAPDLIVEVVSPSSKSHDLLVKKELYLKAGVKEYWIVSSPYKAVVCYLANASYQEVIYQSHNGILEIPAGIFQNTLRVTIAESDIFR